MRITAMVIFILVGATVFSLVFQGVNGGEWIEHMLTDLPGGQVGFLIFVNVFVFFLAFFLDFFEIAFIVIPLLAPVAEKLGIDLIWFGVLLCVNMQTSFMHPPFGFALFYLRGIAPKEVKSSDIYWGSIPWVILQLILVLIVIIWPQSVTYWIGGHTQIDQYEVQKTLDNLIMPGAPGAPGEPGGLRPELRPASEDRVRAVHAKNEKGGLAARLFLATPIGVFPDIPGISSDRHPREGGDP